MLWALVWTVLVVGAVVGAVVVGRRLWRSVRALLAEVTRAGEVAGRLADRADALARLAGEAPAAAGPDLFTDPAVVRARTEPVRERSRERRAAREVRHRETYARWRRDWS
ncbi:hypothetical protein [Cellulomonas endophytica]|uniref:hypothetical protein n=1 Tax=Cellulomonas endophytica TaxID=2494735 RepID=UPI0010104400|nr:hypothetical protein [Cellulomonas endophytica]